MQRYLRTQDAMQLPILLNKWNFQSHDFTASSLSEAMANDLQDVDDAHEFRHLTCTDTRLLVFTESGFFSRVAYECGDDVYWDISYLYDEFRDRTQHKDLTSKGFVKLFKDTAVALKKPKTLHLKGQSDMCSVQFGNVYSFFQIWSWPLIPIILYCSTVLANYMALVWSSQGQALMILTWMWTVQTPGWSCLCFSR